MVYTLCQVVPNVCRMATYIYQLIADSSSLIPVFFLFTRTLHTAVFIMYPFWQHSHLLATSIYLLKSYLRS